MQLLIPYHPTLHWYRKLLVERVFKSLCVVESILNITPLLDFF